MKIINISAHLLAVIILVLFIGCKPGPKGGSANMQQNCYSLKEGSTLLFIGTYTEKESWVNGKGEGIYVYQMDEKTGRLSFFCKSPRTINPTFLAIHPNKQCLYSVNEIDYNGKDSSGTVSAFQIDIAHKRLDLNGTVSSHGKSPCFVSTDKYGKYALTANYGSGTVALFPIARFGSLLEAVSIDQHTGRGPTDRQEGPHAHMITPSPYKDFFYSCDLGTDKIITYILNRSSSCLVPAEEIAKTAPGAGPRQITFHPFQPWAYVVNELNGTIEAFQVNTDNGKLTHFQTMLTHEDKAGDTAASADIHIAPSGKFLYVSNRGNVNNIGMFRIDPKSGMLSLIGYQSVFGKTPRNFVIDPSGTFLLVANQDSDNIVTFRIDPETGILHETGIITKVPTPVCLKFL